MSGIRGVDYIDENGNRILTGGKKAAAKNLARDPDFYSRIGTKGGKNGHTGGFAANRELARTAGKKGRRISRRGPAKPSDLGDGDTVISKPMGGTIKATTKNWFRLRSKLKSE